MPRPPNYSQERKDRERAKAAKKAEKLAIKQKSREDRAPVDAPDAEKPADEQD